MKTTMVFLCALMIGASGCRPDAKTEARLKKIEERQEHMVDGLDGLRKILEEVSKSTRDVSESNMMAISMVLSNSLSSLETTLEMQADVEAVRATNAYLLGRLGVAQRATANAARPAIYAATRDGVPIAVYNRIAADAAQKWGSDFGMQKYEVEKQVEAWRKLNP